MVREGGLPRWPRGRVGDIFVYPSRHAEDGQIRKWWRGDHALPLYNIVVKGETCEKKKKEKKYFRANVSLFPKSFRKGKICNLKPRHFLTSMRSLLPFTGTIIQREELLTARC